MAKDIKRAKTAGFCMGVALALKKLNASIEDEVEGCALYTFGPIIHNPQVLERYKKKGILQADALEEIQPPARVVIRAHGIPLLLEEALSDKLVDIVDATCPKVKKAQLLIQKQVRTGKTLLLFGEKDHPEVKGLLSYAGNDAVVFENFDKFREIRLLPEKEYFLAAQTTQDRDEFNRIVDYLVKELGEETPVLDTICDATRQRQKEARDVAREVEYMVVVGGFSSGNTRRLTQVVRETGTPCIQVETPGQLPLDELQKYRSIGLTAGASTPKDIIDEVEEKLMEMQ